MPSPIASQPRRPFIRQLGLVAAVVLLGVASVATGPSIAAQSATPVAVPSAACAVTSPVAAPDVPASIPASSGTPAPVIGADPATAAAIRSLVESLAACLTDGNADLVAQLVTERYLSDAYGAGERLTREDYLALAPSAPVVPVRIVSIGQIGFNSSDSATAQVITVQGNQLRTEEWTFLFRRNRQGPATPEAGAGTGRWLVHQIDVLPSVPPDDAATMQAEQTEYAIELTPDSVEGPNLVVTIENAGKQAHEFLTLRLDPGTTLDALIRPTSPEFPDTMQVIGQATVPPGETRTIVFVDLEPGTYTVVCLLPDADGVPHLALDETATFTVT